MLKSIRFILLVVFMSNGLIAQELKFSHITAEQGLSMGTVNCILHDRHGFMWFGTQDGLNKYDGYTITVFKHNPLDSNTISNNFIHTLFEDKDGLLWIGTAEGGVDAMNLSTGKIKHYSHKKNNINSISNNSVRAIIEDAQGWIWVGTENGLNAINKKNESIIRYQNEKNNPNSLSNNFIWTLEYAQSGKIIIGTDGSGIAVFDAKANVFSNYLNTLNKGQNEAFESSNRIRDVLEDKEGNFLLASDGAGVFVFDPKKGVFKNFKLNNKLSDSGNRITSLTKDAQNVLWVGTYGDGLILYSETTGKSKNVSQEQNNKYALSNNKIKYVLHDNIGSVWIGTEGGGVNIHFRASNKFKHYKTDNTQNSIKNNVILALLEDKDGLLWIGTNNGGLTSLDREKDEYIHYPHLSPSSNNSVLSLFQDKDELIWIGTWGAGLLSYDKKSKKKTSYSAFTTSNNSTIVCITQSESGLIWVGTYGGGLFSIDKEKNITTNYTISNGLSSNNIYTIFEDSKQAIWIGYDGGGVNLFNPQTGEIKKYEKNSNKNSISSNTVNHIYEDEKGDMWFATTNGLNRLNIQTQTFDTYYEKDGLPNDYIYCIMPDAHGNFWMTTNKGVSKFNPAKTNDKELMFRNYDVNDGLQGMEHNQGAFFKSKSGEMVIGGVNGFNVFTPEKITDNNIPPPVKIISYKRFGREIQLDTLIYDKKVLNLTWEENYFAFDFVALDYQMPGKNRYSYKLEGVDEEWSPAGTQKYASYTELKGGDYVFRVRAANSEGVWNNEGVALYISIQPPFWETTWFYILCIVIIMFSFWAFIRYRTRAIIKENKLLEEKVNERTFELAQKNNDITSSIQYAKRIQLAILPPLEQIYKHFKESFVLYKPKDIVSGDFYWFGVKNGKQIIAVVDCTGHGVPGAFMSMIGYNLLNQIILENGITQPGLILNALHNGVQAALKQGTNVVDTSDGMDIALCSIDFKDNTLEFAGAYRPLYLISDGNWNKIEPDKFSIGGASLDIERKFTNHRFHIKAQDIIYMYSDGYADQFGGLKGKKFMVKQLNSLLFSIKDKPFAEQAQLIEDALLNWKGNFQQVDDILIMGIRF